MLQITAAAAIRAAIVGTDIFKSAHIHKTRKRFYRDFKVDASRGMGPVNAAERRSTLEAVAREPNAQLPSTPAQIGKLQLEYIETALEWVS